MSTFMGALKQDKHSATNILYLFLSFPLGLFYFIFLVVGLSIGFGTLIIGVGIPILLITLAAAWGMALLEREMTSRLLHVDIPGASNRRARPEGILKQFYWRLSDLSTWKSLLYLLVKFPFGVLAFSLTLSLLTLSIAFMFEPLVYMLNLSIDSILIESGVENVQGWLPFVGFYGSSFDLTAFMRTFIATPIGIALWFISLAFLNGMARTWGEFARVMLSPSEQQMPVLKQEPSYGYSRQDYYPAGVRD